ncbi:MAG: hypothetical protein ABJG78_17955 [Cyclobacteriaceae bacterium]
MEDIFLTVRTTITILALAAGVIISIKSILSLFSGLKYTEFDSVLAKFFIVTIYIQFGLELVNFFTSTHTYEESFQAIEHIALVVVATAAVQVGRMISIKSDDDLVKFRFRTIFYGIATFLLLYSFIL